MSPFREPPPIELGPLDVGLEAAAREAERRIPRGGRLLAVRAATGPAHAGGALGSAGFLAVFAVAGGAWLAEWTPKSTLDVVLCLGGVIAGGVSLAAVLRAVDRLSARATRGADALGLTHAAASPPIESGAVVGRAARRAVVRLAQLAKRARSSPATFGGRRVAALRRALHAAKSPEIARWIPTDLRGRGELLLARAIAAELGPRLSIDGARRAEVASLLSSAAAHLCDPRSATLDLAALDRRPAKPQRLRIAQPSIETEDDDQELFELPLHRHTAG